MSGDIWLEPTLRRIAANHQLNLAGLTREAGALIVHAARLVDMPQSWLDGETSMDPDFVESISMALQGALDAIEAELNSPTRPLRMVKGGKS